MDSSINIEPHRREATKLQFTDTAGDIDHPKLVNEVRTLLSDYLESSNVSTKNSFCLKNNLNSTTISKLLSGKTKQFLDAENVKKIIFGINRGEKISKVLEEAQGECGKFLRKHYSGLLATNIQTSLQAYLPIITSQN